MEVTLWETIKDGLGWLIAAVIGLIMYFIKRILNNTEKEISEIRKEVYELDKRQSVAESQINNIREAIERLEKTIKDSEENIKSFIRDLVIK